MRHIVNGQEVKKLSFLRGVEWNSTKSEPKKASFACAILPRKRLMDEVQNWHIIHDIYETPDGHFR